MISLIIFLCFAAFMFVAGYQWRKLDEEHGRLTASSDKTAAREMLWRDMLGKI